MRRLAIAALSAATVLSACTEKPRETPTEPSTSAPTSVQAATGSCQEPFPLTDLLMKTGSMFDGAPVGNAADAKIRRIGDHCSRDKVGTARHEALNFVDWMIKKYGQDQLPNGSALKLTDLISTLFVAVGFQDGEIDPGAFGPGGAAGVYDENSTEDFLLQNENQSAAVLIRPGCLPTSLITMIRLPDSPQLINTGGRRQFPPFYDINAANPEGDKTIAPECADLLVGFCVDDAVLAQTDNPQIGHNKADDATTEENEEGEFEVLRAANSDEYGQLDLAFCPAQANPGFNEEFGLSPAGGLEGLALSAWHRARGYVRPLTNIVLPQQLHATTLGGLGLGGGGRSISPHGVVDDVVLESRFDGDPEGQTFEENSTISWNCEGTCFPAVRVKDFFDTGVAGADVNVALVQVAGSGELTDGEGGTPDPVTTDESGSAVFDDLRITAPGTYQLEFSTRGNTISLLSGEFTATVPLSFGFEDGEPTWDPTGFWNPNTLTGITNDAFLSGAVQTFVLSPTGAVVAGGALPAPFAGAHALWYGQPSTGNFQGSSANSGRAVSPSFTVPDAAVVTLQFKTWWEIEGVQPAQFDIMSIEIQRADVPGTEAIRRLNPAANSFGNAGQPYTSGGFDTAPVWQDVSIDISRFRGENVKLHFAFATGDGLYNNFRGWIVDQVAVSVGSATGLGLRVLGQSISEDELVPIDQMTFPVRPQEP